MFRRLLLTAALLLGLVFAACTPGHDGCEIVYLNGPDNHPAGWVYFSEPQSWHTWVGGQLVLMGYSADYDSIIWNEYYCTLGGLAVNPDRS
jgi:hypothetical protein